MLSVLERLQGTGISDHLADDEETVEHGFRSSMENWPPAFTSINFSYGPSERAYWPRF